MLSAQARAVTDRVVVPIARWLVRRGVTANALTAFGLAVTLAGVGVVAAGYPIVGGAVMAVGLLTDAVDGAVARAQGAPTRFGSFFDSVADRVGDAAALGLLAWLVADRPVVLALALLAFAAAFTTSYVRAKAESLGWQATTGVLERPERMIVVVAGIVLDLVPVAVAVLAVGGVVTVAQRVVSVGRQARGHDGSGGDRASGGDRGSGTRRRPRGRGAPGAAR